jgi:hypothetical protein
MRATSTLYAGALLAALPAALAATAPAAVAAAAAAVPEDFSEIGPVLSRDDPAVQVLRESMDPALLREIDLQEQADAVRAHAKADPGLDAKLGTRISGGDAEEADAIAKAVGGGEPAAAAARAASMASASALDAVARQAAGAETAREALAAGANPHVRRRAAAAAGLAAAAAGAGGVRSRSASSSAATTAADAARETGDVLASTGKVTVRHYEEEDLAGDPGIGLAIDSAWEGGAAPANIAAPGRARPVILPQGAATTAAAAAARAGRGINVESEKQSEEHCLLCDLLLRFSTEVARNGGHDTSLEPLRRVCGTLPHQWVGRCLSYVTSKGHFFMAAARMSRDANVVCEKLHNCAPFPDDEDMTQLQQ